MTYILHVRGTPPTDVEEMTTKTGNFKKFPVFCKMLHTALTRASESVFIDLLTIQDLETLRARRQQRDDDVNTSTAPVSSSLAKSNKRFLILTYLVEFDRVHFPLPLRFEDEPAADALRRTVQRLRAQLAAAGGDEARAPIGTGDATTASAELQTARDTIARLTTEVGGPGVDVCVCVCVCVCSILVVSVCM